MNIIKSSTFFLILLSLTSCRNETSSSAEQPPDFGPLLTWLQSVEPERYGSLTPNDLGALKSIRLDGSERPGQIDILADESNLQELASLPALKSLAIWTTKLSDEGMAIIGRFDFLQNLEVGGWGVRYTDEGLASLKNMKKLNRLKLVHAQGITDDGMVVLSELPALIDLDITYTKITNEGLATLAKSKSLKVVRYGWAAESKRWQETFKNSGIPYSFELK